MSCIDPLNNITTKQGASPEKRGAPFFVFLPMRKIIIHIILILLGLNGCVAPILPPARISATPPFNYRNGRAIKIRIARDINLIRRPRIIYIKPVDSYQKVKKSGLLSKEIGSSLRDYFYRGLVREVYKDTIVIKDGNLEWYDDPENQIFILELAITHMKKGNGLLRYLIGFGLGQTDLQVEGRLFDHKTLDEIFAFTIRSRHAGNSYQGLNPRALSGKYCLRMSAQEMAITISRHLREVWHNIDKSGMVDPLRQAAWER